MPRQSRKKSSTGIYHVMLRGINKQDIFEEEERLAGRFFDLEVQSGRAERRRALLKRIILKIKDEIKQKRFKVLLSEASPLILAPKGA